MKWNILRHLVEIGCKVTVMPGSSPAEAILDAQPDGIFISNGPGDPRPLSEATETLRTLIRTAAERAASRSSGSAWAISSWARPSVRRPSSSSSATEAPITRSATRNPARSRSRLRTMDSPSTPPTLPADVIPSHVNLNDQTLEGLRHTRLPIFSVQYHPEAMRRPPR